MLFYPSILSTDVPGPPENLELNKLSPTSVKLTWSPPESDGGSPVTGYIIQFIDEYTPNWSTITPEPTTDTHYTLKDLEEGLVISFRVLAQNKAGKGPASDKVVLKVFPPSPPGVPDVSDVTNVSVKLNWTAPESDGGSKVTGYIIEMKDTHKERWHRANRIPTKNLELVVQDLVENTEYEFRVLAQNKVGLSEPSGPSMRVVAKLPYSKLSIICDFVFAHTDGLLWLTDGLYNSVPARVFPAI